MNQYQTQRLHANFSKFRNYTVNDMLSSKTSQLHAKLFNHNRTRYIPVRDESSDNELSPFLINPNFVDKSVQLHKAQGTPHAVLQYSRIAAARPVFISHEAKRFSWASALIRIETILARIKNAVKVSLPLQSMSRYTMSTGNQIRNGKSYAIGLLASIAIVGSLFAATITNNGAQPITQPDIATSDQKEGNSSGSATIRLASATQPTTSSEISTASDQENIFNNDPRSVNWSNVQYGAGTNQVVATESAPAVSVNQQPITEAGPAENSTGGNTQVEPTPEVSQPMPADPTVETPTMPVDDTVPESGGVLSETIDETTTAINGITGAVGGLLGGN